MQGTREDRALARGDSNLACCRGKESASSTSGGKRFERRAREGADAGERAGRLEGIEDGTG